MNVQNVGGYRTGIDYLPAAGKNIFERENVNFNVEEAALEKGNEGAVKTAEQKTQDLKDAYAVMTSGVGASKAASKNETIQIWLNQTICNDLHIVGSWIYLYTKVCQEQW